MEIKIENAKAAFEMADEKTKKVLLSLLPELKETVVQTAVNRPITERVKTFEDACRELGECHPFVLAYKNTNLRDPEVAEENRDILAYMKLRIIVAALNDGWEPEFTEDEWRWYPWFTLYTEKELSDKSDEWKADRQLISIDDYSKDFVGMSFAKSRLASLYSPSDISSRLCFKSEALAAYCGKQFTKLWIDFSLIKKS